MIRASVRMRRQHLTLGQVWACLRTTATNKTVVYTVTINTQNNSTAEGSSSKRKQENTPE